MSDWIQGIVSFRFDSAVSKVDATVLCVREGALNKVFLGGGGGLPRLAFQKPVCSVAERCKGALVRVIDIESGEHSALVLFAFAR